MSGFRAALEENGNQSGNENAVHRRTIIGDAVCVSKPIEEVDR